MALTLTDTGAAVFETNIANPNLDSYVGMVEQMCMARTSMLPGTLYVIC